MYALDHPTLRVNSLPAPTPRAQSARRRNDIADHRQAYRLARVSLEFVVAQFDGEGAAVKRYADAKERSSDDARWTREVGFVEHHHNGRLVLRGTFAGHYLDVDESDHVSEKGAGAGAVAGGLAGALLGPAGIALGIAVGGVAGSQLGSPSDTEAEPAALADQLRATIPRSSSAIVLIAAPDDVEAMLAALGEDARVVRNTLSADQAAELEASLRTAPPPSPGP